MNCTTANARPSPTPARTSTAATGCETRARRAGSFFTMFVMLLTMLGSQAAVCAPPSANAKPADAAAFGFSSFSQDKNAMEFFRARAKDPRVRIHAAIATVPDPIATRLGRSFDLEVAALITAFEVRDYVLDGFWLTWPLDGKQADDTRSRNEPSVLAFRKDVWRRCAVEQPEPGCANAPAVEYYVLLLVGEAPTFGIHRQAFAAAARVAAEFELWSSAHRAGAASSDGADSALPGSGEKGGGNPPAAKRVVLKVIGPSFSGSMQSLMDALDNAASDPVLLAFASEPCPAANAQGKAPACPRLQAQLHSPSATVLSNANANNPTAHAVSNLELLYRPIATDQCMQLRALFEYLGTTQNILHKDIAILAEESSFGLGASACPLADPKSDHDSQPTLLQFPQNIASIRAEHAQLSKKDTGGQSAFSLPSKFLELDMTGVDLGKDLPPPYQPNLSTRSDELVLHQMLDALATFRRPAATIIIATDIRDRLFLLNEIKSALPGTLPVVLEVDNLMVHPDYRQLSRGSVVVGAGDTLVCIDLEPGSKKKEISCRPGAPNRLQPATTTQSPCSAKQVLEATHALQYFPFATDYAANTFRAVLRVTEPAETDKPECPQLLVATLAGFQPIGDLSTIGIPSDSATLGMLLSSETHADLWRFLMPVIEIASLLFLLIAVWLWNDRTGIRVLVPLPRHSIHWLGARASLCWQWLFHRAAYLANRKATDSPPPGHKHFTAIRYFAFLLGIVALGGLAASTFRTAGFLGHDAVALLHGRDQVAMLAVFAVFGAVIVMSGLRLLIWNGLCRKIADATGVPAVMVERLREGGYFRGILAIALLLAVVAVSANGSSATTVDPQPLAILLSIAALGAGTYFLVQLWFQLLRLQQLSREYARAIPIIQSARSQPDWPTPLGLGQSPTNPLNLVLFREDLERLSNDDVIGWAQQTVNVICGKWPFTNEPDDPAFAIWQRYLVAQMKAGASVLRGCAWAALMAPICALVMLEVYPAPYERLQTITAIGLMALSFCAVVIATLRLEKDILLSRMFTKDADRVSFGDAIGTLLPKLLVVLGVLISVFAPDLLSLLPDLSKLLGAAH
ncbi:MAG TPA: hypothetical protein VFI49_13080 [Rudaea sp.]|nr:hypothetical protein [Rudaea sp.]